MITSDLYSVRMRASAQDRHVSGSERIVHEERIPATVQTLTARAYGRSVVPDQVVLTIDKIIGQPILMLRSLDFRTMNCIDVQGCRTAAIRILQNCGITINAIDTAIRNIDAGAASGNSMRGAMIMDAGTGDRLEPDRERGIRVSRFDWTDEASILIDQALTQAGLTHFRVKEALALATKVSHASGIVAELCWSDDPDYSAGYIASPGTGYVRFPFLKHTGSSKGGRVFFVHKKDVDINAFVEFLQKTPVLIDAAGRYGGIE